MKQKQKKKQDKGRDLVNHGQIIIPTTRFIKRWQKKYK